MTLHTYDLHCTLTIPRPLAGQFAAPADLKAYLLEQHIWPTRVHTERWRLEGQGYVVELDLDVPEPHRAGGPPDAA